MPIITDWAEPEPGGNMQWCKTYGIEVSHQLPAEAQGAAHPKKHLRLNLRRGHRAGNNRDQRRCVAGYLSADRPGCHRGGRAGDIWLGIVVRHAIGRVLYRRAAAVVARVGKGKITMVVEERWEYFTRDWLMLVPVHRLQSELLSAGRGNGQRR